jgi:hypothetical protein
VAATGCVDVGAGGYRLDFVDDHIDGMIDADPTISAGRIWERLIDDHDVTAAYTTVRDYITHRRASPRPAARTRARLSGTK